MKSTCEEVLPLLLKIYFWIFSVGWLLSSVFELTRGRVLIWGVLDLGISALGILGLFGYLYQKHFFSQIFWKFYLPVVILWDIVGITVVQPAMVKQEFNLISLFGFVFVLPLYYGLYRYAFKSEWS